MEKEIVFFLFLSLSHVQFFFVSSLVLEIETRVGSAIPISLNTTRFYNFRRRNMVSCVVREEKGLALNIYSTNFYFLFKVARVKARSVFRTRLLKVIKTNVTLKQKYVRDKMRYSRVPKIIESSLR